VHIGIIKKNTCEEFLKAVTQLFILEEVNFLGPKHGKGGSFRNRPLSCGQKRHIFVYNVTVIIFLYGYINFNFRIPKQNNVVNTLIHFVSIIEIICN